ncbi:MAG TPA: hypothetical protein PKW35_04450 [Nannocystaceae bacterium]|nr:hypothetical protein [Nannocystaceae bacterium]
MTIYLALKTIHILATSIWLGAAITTPADVRGALRLGPTHAEELLRRLRRTAKWMNLAGYATILSGVGLILALGGWGAVPPRIHLGLALTLLIFAVGRYLIRPSIIGIGAALREGALDRHAEGLAARITRGVWAEHALRLAVLLLMLVPFGF